MKSLWHTAANAAQHKWIALGALCAAAVGIHGYHYGIEDEAIYLPAIKAHLHPALYPHDRIFFEPQAKPMLFDELVAGLARAFHAPVDVTVFALYLLSLLILLAALWTLAAELLPGARARLGGVALVTVLLTMPVAGTCIFLADQHLHPRTPATALILWAVALVAPAAEGRTIGLRKGAAAFGLIALAATMHPQMAFYGALYVIALLLPSIRAGVWLGAIGCLLLPVIGLWLGAGSPEWMEASRTREQHYLLRWHWYEWLGAVAPIFVLMAMARLARRRGMFMASAVAARTALFTAVGFVAALIITIPPEMERLTPYQPLRTLHMTYLVMILLAGGMLAEFVLKDRPWRWAVLLLPLAGAMSYVQFDSFSGSRHIELPDGRASNDWVEAFLWVKANTPVDAYFALDPRYMSTHDEDFHGFRALAERSQMADWDKDPGVALLFPVLVPRWHREVHALDGFDRFTSADFARLHREFGVGWTVISSETPPPGIDAARCPWKNRTAMVCRLE